LIGLTTLEVDPGFTAAFPARQGARVEIETADGKLHQQALADVVPATEAEIRARFGAAATDALGRSRAAAIEQFIEKLESAESVGEVLQRG